METIQLEPKKKERFEAFSRMCLNNWHYIDRKVLSFHKEINFFTGHSGSGKSTIIDALQIVLYANTDGRGFFNKAAAEDSDRNLIEYLRGMVNIEDNNENAYLRNKNFSSTIVLEFEQSDTGDKQCVGVVFDVETSTNEITRCFFQHKGSLLPNEYRMSQRPMSTGEVREYLTRTFDKQDFFTTSRNETFRRRLYDDYLGGLDREKFPMLFKRAIPFKMNSRLEDFVKEYICMEQDIHIEDMQESVMQYGRMQKKIMDTCSEIADLEQIKESFQKVEEKKQEYEKYNYFCEKLELLQQKEQLEEMEKKMAFHQQDFTNLKEKLRLWEAERQELNDQKEEQIRLIAQTGYQEAVDQLQSLNQLLERMNRSKARWDDTASGLKAWAENDLAGNTVLWQMEQFEQYEMETEDIEELKGAIRELVDEVKAESAELERELRELYREQRQTLGELSELHKGSKAYPKEIIEARQLIYQGLSERLHKAVRVDVLADLIDMKEERWRNAVEGYMGNNKLLLVVEPRYVSDALAVYRSLDQRKYFRAAILDTEKITGQAHTVKEGSLAESVKAREPYVRSYLDYLLGGVVKCDTVEEMREHAVAVMDDGTLYHGYKLSHMNPRNYTKDAYIGAESLKRRILLLKKQEAALEQKRKPKEEQKLEYEKMLSLEQLNKDTGEYMEWLSDIRESRKIQQEKQSLELRIEKLQQKDVAGLKQRKEELEQKLADKEQQIRKAERAAGRLEDGWTADRQSCIEGAHRLAQLERSFSPKPELEKEAGKVLEGEGKTSCEKLQRRYSAKREEALEEKQRLFQALAQLRSEYLKRYPNRSFGAFSEDNKEYDKLLTELSCDDLERFRQLAKEQAKSAVLHFKEDFIYKIRAAILDAFERKDELNRIIDKLDFGKDKYQFIFTKNKGEDGKYFDMFMDEALDINPNQLTGNMDHQMNLFTLEHEEKYGEMLTELMSVFIPPVDAGAEEQEEARRNMERYADYRTYLSFDMQQIIESENGPIKLKLSRMLKKNSGGEGQNPLYVALLASFAQAYRINMPSRLLRSPTIRLVVLDEAFSKMDGEKVASCISLIRSLGFQVIISATNDKIQNYLENVDKTFVFANPNKKSISIQEFEKREFEQLAEEE